MNKEQSNQNSYLAYWAEAHKFNSLKQKYKNQRHKNLFYSIKRIFGKSDQLTEKDSKNMIDIHLSLDEILFDMENSPHNQKLRSYIEKTMVDVFSYSSIHSLQAYGILYTYLREKLAQRGLELI